MCSTEREVRGTSAQLWQLPVAIRARPVVVTYLLFLQSPHTLGSDTSGIQCPHVVKGTYCGNAGSMVVACPNPDQYNAEGGLLRTPVFQCIK